MACLATLQGFSFVFQCVSKSESRTIQALFRSEKRRIEDRPLKKGLQSNLINIGAQLLAKRYCKFILAGFIKGTEKQSNRIDLEVGL